MAEQDAVELARARLAWISAGPRPVQGPRRAVAQPEGPDQELEELNQPPPDDGLEGAGPSAARDGAGPESAPGSVGATLASRLRGHPQPRYLVVVCVLLLAGVIIAVVVLTRSQASQVEITPVVVEEAPAHSPTPEPVLIRVHVLGAVATPGVVALPEDAIVADALAAAGGLAPGADPGELNLAARLGDGQQVLVGTAGDPRGEVRDGGETGAGSGSAGEGGKVDLNRATAAQLEELPGVGPVTAAAIVAWREDNDGFSTVADLQEVPGIGPKTFATLEPLVTV